MKSKLILLLTAFFLCSAFKADKPVITIFMIGDSTMSNKSLVGGNPERGWGHVLPGFFSEDIRVDNHAMNGRSSKSFIDEGRWDKVLSLIKKRPAAEAPKALWTNGGWKTSPPVCARATCF